MSGGNTQINELPMDLNAVDDEIFFAVIDSVPFTLYMWDDAKDPLFRKPPTLGDT